MNDLKDEPGLRNKEGLNPELKERGKSSQEADTGAGRGLARRTPTLP